MSCPLDKLAPETRVLIYEYVLAFDTPLKHVTEMRPFVKKLTGVEPTSDSRITGSEIKTTTDMQCVNTSILTANKLIYTEAIAVLYARNTIVFDAQMCKPEDLVSARATDLSLAKHVIVKMNDSVDPTVSGRIGSADSALFDHSSYLSQHAHMQRVHLGRYGVRSLGAPNLSMLFLAWRRYVQRGLLQRRRFGACCHERLTWP